MKQVTEQDIRLPQFRDAELDELEFDSSGVVVRKDRFETAMRKISGKMHGVNGLSPREKWTCEQVVEAVNNMKTAFNRLVELTRIVELEPLNAEYFHWDNQFYVNNIDQEHLEIAKKEPQKAHIINFNSMAIGAEFIEPNSGFIELIEVLVPMDDIKREISAIVQTWGGV